jgi:hypothetical protein
LPTFESLPTVGGVDETGDDDEEGSQVEQNDRAVPFFPGLGDAERFARRAGGRRRLSDEQGVKDRGGSDSSTFDHFGCEMRQDVA